MTTPTDRAFRSALDLLAGIVDAEDVDLDDLRTTLDAWADARRAASADSDADETTELVRLFADSGLDRIDMALTQSRAVIFVTPDAVVNFAWDDDSLPKSQCAAISHVMGQMLTGQTLQAEDFMAQGGVLQ